MSAPTTCAVCGNPGMNRLCPSHLAEWLASPERLRWAYWTAKTDAARTAAAFRDFATTRQAERRNSPENDGNV